MFLIEILLAPSDISTLIKSLVFWSPAVAGLITANPAVSTITRACALWMRIFILLTSFGEFYRWLIPYHRPMRWVRTSLTLCRWIQYFFCCVDVVVWRWPPSIRRLLLSALLNGSRFVLKFSSHMALLLILEIPWPHLIFVRTGSIEVTLSRRNNKNSSQSFICRIVIEL